MLSEDVATGMPWTKPHPRRLPTSNEYKENERIIKELESKINQLKQEIEDLEWERDKRRSFVAPFRRLPCDILCEIASHFVQERGSPQTLNQTCFSLREAVNGHKRLWSKIFLSIPLEDGAETQFYEDRFQGYIACESGSKEYLQLLLDRAQPTPMCIAIEERYTNWDEQRTITALMKLLSPISHSIKSLSVINSPIYSEYSPLDLTGLQELFLCYPTDAAKWSLRSLGVSFDSLSSLTIRTVFEDTESILRGLPLHAALQVRLELSILHYELDNGPATHLERIHLPDIPHLTIMALPALLRYINVNNVITLKIIGEDPEPEDSEDSEEIDWNRYDRHRRMRIGDIPSADTIETLDIIDVLIETAHYRPCQFLKLQILRLAGTCWKDGRGHTELLLAPQLKKLTLEHYEWGEPDNFRLFGPFSFPHLSPNQITEKGDIINYSRTGPNILSLRIVDCTDNGEFLRALSNVDGRRMESSPTLELIELCGCTWADEYGYSQFINDCSVGRPDTRLIVDV